MNYLIESFLTKNYPRMQVGCLVGNLIHKKGPYLLVQEQILAGAAFHFTIKNFLKDQPGFIKSKSRFRNQNIKYTEKFVFIIYNHFFALYWDQISPDIPLKEFTKNTYANFIEHLHFMPHYFKRLIPVMTSTDWFLEFQSIGGIHKAVSEMEKISIKPYNFDFAIEEFINSYEGFQSDFLTVLPEILSKLKIETDYKVLTI